MNCSDNFTLAKEPYVKVRHILDGHARKMEHEGWNPPHPTQFFVDPIPWNSVPYKVLEDWRQHGSDMREVAFQNMLWYMYPNETPSFRTAFAHHLNHPDTLQIAYRGRAFAALDWKVHEHGEPTFLQRVDADFGIFSSCFGLEWATCLAYDQFGELARRTARSTIRPPGVPKAVCVDAYADVRFVMSGVGINFSHPPLVFSLITLAMYARAFPFWRAPSMLPQPARGIEYVGGATASSGTPEAIPATSTRAQLGIAAASAPTHPSPNDTPIPRSNHEKPAHARGSMGSPAPITSSRPSLTTSQVTRAPSRGTIGSSHRASRTALGRESKTGSTRRMDPPTTIKATDTSMAKAKDTPRLARKDDSPRLPSTKRAALTSMPASDTSRRSLSAATSRESATLGQGPRRASTGANKPTAPVYEYKPSRAAAKMCEPDRPIAPRKEPAIPGPDVYGNLHPKALEQIESIPALPVFPATEARPPRHRTSFRREELVEEGALVVQDGHFSEAPVHPAANPKTALVHKRSSAATPAGATKRPRVSTGGASSAGAAVAAAAVASGSSSGDAGLGDLGSDAGQSSRARARSSWTRPAAASASGSFSAGGRAGSATVSGDWGTSASAKGKGRARDEDEHSFSDGEPIPEGSSLFSPGRH